jgi:hypothetical protein
MWQIPVTPTLYGNGTRTNRIQDIEYNHRVTVGELLKKE